MTARAAPRRTHDARGRSAKKSLSRSSMMPLPRRDRSRAIDDHMLGMKSGSMKLAPGLV